MLRRTLLAPLLIFVTVFAHGEQPSSPPHIGISSILTGPWASWGTSVKDGFLLAAEHSGLPFKIEFQDDQADSKQVLSNVQKFLMERKDLIVIGPMEGIDAAAPIVAKHGLPVIALGEITDDILRRQPNVIALNTYADADPRYTAAFLAKVGMKRLAIVNGSNNVGEAMGARMETEAKLRSITVVSHDAVQIDTADFRTLAAKIRKSAPDAVFIHQGDHGLLNFVRQLRLGGYKGEILTIFTFESDETRKAYGTYLNGVKYTFPLGADPTDANWRSFSDAFEKRYGYLANANAAMAYDSFRILEQALVACPDAKLDCFTEHFKKHSDYSGAAGSLRINENRGPQRPMGIKEIRDGKFEWVLRDIVL